MVGLVGSLALLLTSCSHARDPSATAGTSQSADAGTNQYVIPRLTLHGIPKSASEHSMSGTFEYPNEVAITNKTLYDIIYFFCPEPKPVIDEADLNEDKYNLTITGADDANNRHWKLIQKMLQEHFGLETSPARRDIRLYELRTGETFPTGLKESTKSSPGEDTQGVKLWMFYGYSMGDLTDKLNKLLDLPVYDETHLTNRYDFVMKWDAKFHSKIAEASVKKIGLRLDEVKKEKEVLVIRKIASTQTK
jgi:uncharacterized protein (TIGR03435 family)